MVQEELSKEDQSRIRGCDHYSKTLEIMAANERYKDLSVGEVYFIKSMNSYDKDYRYVNRGYKSKPSKFMIFHKDNKGFIFMKRINANGKLGKEVVCLTTQYSHAAFELEPDPDYVEAIIFQNEDNYDPLKAEKDLVKKKGQASRKNKKLELKFPTAQGAFDYVKSLKPGDRMWRAHTTFGRGITEHMVEKTQITKVDRSLVSNGRYTGRDHRIHDQQGLTEVVEVTLKILGKNSHGTDKVIFQNFYKDGYRSPYYKNKPYTTDDV